MNTSALYNLGSLLLKTGRVEEGNRILEKFRALQQKGDAAGSTGMGNQYGEMGAYAMAIEYKPAGRPATVAPKPADYAAPFKARTREAGLAEFAQPHWGRREDQQQGRHGELPGAADIE